MPSCFVKLSLKFKKKRRMYLHPEDLSVIDLYTCNIFGILVLKCRALPRYPFVGLVTGV